MYCGAGLVCMPVKLTTVVPSTAGAKLKVLMEGVKLSLWFVSGNTYGTLCRWLHQVFMSTGVKNIPYAACHTSPIEPKLCANPNLGAKLALLGYIKPFGYPFCPPING